MALKVAATTLGCKANQADTQAMLAELFKAGYEAAEEGEAADVIIVNTCTVTNISDRKSRQALSRAKAENPGALIVAAGCYAQRAPKELMNLGVDLAIGPGSVGDIARLVERAREDGALDAVAALPSEFDAEEARAAEGKTRVNLKIQDGCDRYCAYCIIPYTRGKPRSRPLEDVRKRAISLAGDGYLEIVLTGIHLASYGRDSGASLLDAARAACECVPRVRLGSLEPMLLTDEFIQGLAELPNVCAHFHVSLQSGSEGVLKRMKRQYTPQEYLERIEALRAAVPGAAITTDVIAGFPEETEEEHEETRAFLRKAKLARIHVFPYSKRDGTLAAKMVQLPMCIRQSRAKELIQIAKELERDYMAASVGQIRDILIETHENSDAYGHTDTYLYVRIPGYTGDGIVKARLALEQGGMRGDVLE